MNRKTKIGLIIAIVITSASWYFIREKPILDSTLSVPSETGLENTITLTITSTNNHSDPILLDSIDISDSLIDGFQVLSVDPQPIDTMHLPLFNMRSWEFSKSVPPGESIVVNFELKSVRKGRFTGDVDVCNDNQDFQTLYADIIVKDDLSTPNTVNDPNNLY